MAFEYIKQMDFEEKPNYKLIERYFTRVFNPPVDIVVLNPYNQDSFRSPTISKVNQGAQTDNLLIRNFN